MRELQQENIELQTSVAEYQSALELIMAKYREQVCTMYYLIYIIDTNHRAGFTCITWCATTFFKCLMPMTVVDLHIGDAW